ncbi:MAG: 2-phospho-L-lactate transferase CofD family protein, partial [Gammaproteobacteria bacterium]|nr:2-phospho-L-lactate transferase CofD family protein [Gammaproteobacteria bacterium]
ALTSALTETDGVIICPSNPFVSVDPILALPGMRDALRGTGVPIVAVSPIVGGAAIKGPTAKMMTELSVPVTTEQVARHYADLVTGFLIDTQDADREDAVRALGLATVVAQSVMITLQDRVDLARTVVDFIRGLRKAG